MDYLGKPCNHSGPSKREARGSEFREGDMRTELGRNGRREGERSRERQRGGGVGGVDFENAALLALKMEEGVTSQGMGQPLEAGKCKEHGFCPRMCRRNAALLTMSLAQ